MTDPVRFVARIADPLARTGEALANLGGGPVDPAPDLDQIELPHPVFPPPARLALQFVSSVPTVAPLDGAYRLRVTAVPTVGLPTTLEMPVGAITSTPGGLFLPLGMRAISFHDGRGLIVDPIYVAALFADLQTFLPGLTMNNPAAPINGAGEVQPILGLISGTLVHCLDPHGGVYRPALPAATLVTKSAVAVMGTVPATGLVTLASSGDGIDTAGTDNGRLRWGFLPNGVLGTSRLVPPTPASPLGRQFYQVAVVDAVWTLLGNRTNATVLGVPGDDQTIPTGLVQSIRDNVVINYLTDGPDVLGQAATALARPAASLLLAVSPTLDGTMAIPAPPGPGAHWPAFPLPNPGTTFPSPAASPKDGITAAFTTGSDVVVTVAADMARTPRRRESACCCRRSPQFAQPRN